MLKVLLASSVSFAVTFLSIPAIIKIAQEKKLYDIPDNRKIHKNLIASLGGVGMFPGFFLAALLTVSSSINPEFQYFFAAATVIFFLGLKDDILVITPVKKFIGQISAAAILVHLANIRIGSMHGIFGLYELPYAVSIALTYFTIILIINAYNLIDGVDGLAGTLGLMTMIVFGGYFYMAQIPAYSLLAFSMAGALLAFLMYNYHPAKIFMGDSGSLLVGLLNSILVIKFINVADSTGVAFPLESAVTIGMAILMVPLLDTLRVFSIRIFQGRSPFSPDRNHIHHLLLARGFNHRYVTLSCFLLNVLFIVLAYFGRLMGPTLLLCIMAAGSFAFLAVLLYYKKPQVKRFDEPLKSNVKAFTSNTTKVVPLKPEASSIVEK